ncbi:MAG: TIGR04076 family protein [Candidatus Lokiarchaeota archaeon]|nr:TIGR04076 family protein [Candidatus Lokiarchaeota archaeon]
MVKRLTITVKKIEGTCPVYNVGDKTVINGPEIDLKMSDSVCIHALFSLGTFIVALREGVNPKNIGLSNKDDGSAYFQCPDPGKPYTDGGTVLFEIKQE